MSEMGDDWTKIEPYSPLFGVNPLNMQSVVEDSSQHLSSALFILSSYIYVIFIHCRDQAISGQYFRSKVNYDLTNTYLLYVNLRYMVENSVITNRKK